MAGNLGKGLIQATSSVVQTVHTVAKTSVKTGIEGVLGPSEESLKEIEKQAEIEKLKKKKILVKTPQYLENKHILGELEKRICLNKKEIEEKKKLNPNSSSSNSSGKAEAEQI